MPARAQGTPLQLSFFAVFSYISILRDGGQKCKKNLHPAGRQPKIFPQVAKAAESWLISGRETQEGIHRRLSFLKTASLYLPPAALRRLNTAMA